jgi:preprotein translocase subunit SecA
MPQNHRFKLFSPSMRILRRAKSIANKVDALKDKYRQMSNKDLSNMTNIFLDDLKNGKTLDDIMVDAFAVAREAC